MKKENIVVQTANKTPNGAIIINDKYVIRGSNAKDMLVYHPSQLIGKTITLSIDESNVSTNPKFTLAQLSSVQKINLDDALVFQTLRSIDKTDAEIRQLSNTRVRVTAPAKEVAVDGGEVPVV